GHRQTIDVGSQRDRALVAEQVRTQVGDQPGARTLLWVIAQLRQPALDQPLRPHLLEAELRVLVDVTAYLRERRRQALDLAAGVLPRHGGQSTPCRAGTAPSFAARCDRGRMGP